MNLQRFREQLQGQILGQDVLVEYSLACLLAGGHLLLEGAPGLGKTSLAQALARSFAGGFHRIQMTSDLLPGDIMGVLRFNPGQEKLEFRPGPIFTNILLADELNRAGPKTQAALLEAMAEGYVSVDGKTHELPRPFFVVATQNPQESQGVYPLSESQLDRFMLELPVTPPTEEHELKIYERELKNRHEELPELSAAFDKEALQNAQKQVREVHVEESVMRYVRAIVEKSRSTPELRYGLSVRAGIQLLNAAQALSLLRGKDFVSPAVVRELAPSAFAHRLLFQNSIERTLEQRRSFLSGLLETVPEPR